MKDDQGTKPGFRPGKAPMEPAGNVKGGRYSDASRGGDMKSCNGSFGKPGAVAGSHRKTHSAGKVRAHHRKG